MAEIIQRTRPDVVLLNEFDFDTSGEAVELFRTNHLAVSQHGADPIDYPYWFTASVNTGMPSGFDLDNDGTVGGPNDAFGFGEFPGQYGMVVLSRYPIVTDEVRTFQNLLWSSMPDARVPDDPTTPEPADWYSAAELAMLPLSSKSHWDVPIDVEGQIVHVLASHPTPPTFDGDEDRNGLRNADEIRFWADYVAGDDTDWIVDDAGGAGGLDGDAEFVIMGDLNSDPLDGDSLPGAMQQLLDLDRLHDPEPSSEGAPEAAGLQGTPTPPTRVTQPPTPLTSPTTLRQATCGWTTCCRPTVSTSSMPGCSGHRPAIRSQRSSSPTRSRAPTIASSGSTSTDRCAGPARRDSALGMRRRLMESIPHATA